MQLFGLLIQALPLALFAQSAMATPAFPEHEVAGDADASMALMARSADAHAMEFASLVESELERRGIASTGKHLIGDVFHIGCREVVKAKLGAGHKRSGTRHNAAHKACGTVRSGASKGGSKAKSLYQSRKKSSKKL